MMGICGSSEAVDTEQKKKSQAIDRELESESKRLQHECKILLLGSASVMPHGVTLARTDDIL